MMKRITKVLKPIAIAIVCSAAFSFCIQRLFSQSPQNNHWMWSVGFHTLVALTVAVLALANADPKSLASNLLSVSLGRLLASAIAFLTYKLNFPEFQKWFIVHFMIHYVLFTFFEIVFLLKIVTPKSSNK